MIDSTKKLFRWGPIDAAILPLSYPMIASFDKMYEYFGACWPETLVIFDHDKATWINEMDKLIDACREFTVVNILPEKRFERFNTIWEEKVHDLLEIHRRIEQDDLNRLSDDELLEILKSWNKIYLDFWSVGMTAELFNYELESRMKEILSPKFEDERDMNEAFATLSTPNELSFYKHEETDLMRIVLLKDEEKEKELECHADDYFWILNNYFEATVLNKNYFEDQIKHTKPEDAEIFLGELKEYEEKVAKDKKYYVEKLSFNEEERRILSLLGWAISFQDARKMYNLMTSHYLEEFLKEIEKRTSIKIRDLKWLLPNEIEKLFDNNDLESLIEKRKHLTVFKCSKEKIEEKIQNLASKINKDLNKAEFEKSANIQGTVACTGKERYFRGIAKIIMSPKEGDKLLEGEILVTAMTTPDYVVCMKRAGAIVTDIGGVTCHAAVVSREFGIPCIVGTGSATKSIKDGDILELHNLRGVVKIVS